MENHNNPHSQNEEEKDIFSDEPDLEDFLTEEEEEAPARKKTRSFFAKVTAYAIALSLVVSVLAVWVRVFNLPSFSFLEKSNELSKIENIQNYKEAVVTLEGSGVKGTGFNIAEEGTIVTNYHVIEDMASITVIFPSGDIMKAEPAEEFPDLDIAILEVEGKDLPYLEIQEERGGRKGDSIYVIGNPLAYNQIVMEGDISRAEDRLYLTAPIEKGNSGSPVIDSNGKVIGVVYAMTVPAIGSGKEPEGLAVPVSEIPVLQ
ncbi:trypsin-like peptidase domain-containing protein [Rossellomorea vietnamensis]|uniref:Trypsin-like peptidase domain-containing protein n=1 Tax=Rossellomorea vietnamensis TaxID=218284 RepID=A0A5D4NJ07_9BACI|nr:serine protease [Rossellomorea vietnamensis]TYS13809.1 trypsin-like peptidase domain-containing protein [Rossellomorea vietnamensis]